MQPHEVALRTLSPFLSRGQLATLVEQTDARCEEHAYFRELVAKWAKRIAETPGPYGQDGKGDAATVHLHYFFAASDWYITEKDMDGHNDAQNQAFGFAILNGDTLNAEMGYISIRELTYCGADLDLYFEPTSLRDVKAKHDIPT
jgi:hypothetical protein